MALLATFAESLTETAAPGTAPLESMEFTHALVALVAKLAMVDGTPNKAEYQAFAALFADADRTTAPRLRSLFMKRINDTSDALQYARQLATMTHSQQELQSELLEKLIAIATADAPLNAAETELLRNVAEIFGLSRDQFQSIVARQPMRAASPYDVLGINADATSEQLRAQYLAQVQLLHPDRYQAAGATVEMVTDVSKQLAALNAAYDEIKRLQPAAPAKPRANMGRWVRKNTKGAKAS